MKQRHLWKLCELHLPKIIKLLKNVSVFGLALAMRNTLKAVWLWVNVLLLLLWIIFEFECLSGILKNVFYVLEAECLHFTSPCCACKCVCVQQWVPRVPLERLFNKLATNAKKFLKNSEIKGNIRRLIQLQIRGRSSKVLWGFEVNAILPLCFIYFQLHCPNWPQRWGEKWMGWRRRPRASYPSQTWN